MSDLLSIGRSGLSAYSRALAITGDNIANAETQGYARRSLTLREAPAPGDVALYRASVRPGGVEVAGVNRAVNIWLGDDVRVSGGEAARGTVRAEWLAATERTTEDIGTTLTGIFTTADELAADPANATLRTQFLADVSDTASAFRRTAAGLADAGAGIVADAQATTAQLNTDLAALEKVNQGLRRARDGSVNQASLFDERDRLVNSLSAAIDINVSYDGRGAAAITHTSGTPLVANGVVTSFAVTASPTGLITFSAGAMSVVAASGRLAGLSQAAVQVAAQRSDLDGLASQFASQLNAAHQAGRDAAGNPGLALLSGTSAADLAANALVAGDVAAASVNSDNGNMLALANLRGSTGAEAGWSQFSAAQAQSIAAAQAQAQAAQTRHEGAATARDDVSGVDLDREAAELIRFQQAYQAAAKVIQVARETTQSILDAI